MIELIEKDLSHFAISGFFENQLARCLQLLNRRFHRIFFHTENRRRIPFQGYQRHKAMTLLGKLSKHMENAGVNSEREIAADADAVGYAIRQ